MGFSISRLYKSKNQSLDAALNSYILKFFSFSGTSVKLLQDFLRHTKDERNQSYFNSAIDGRWNHDTGI